MHVKWLLWLRCEVHYLADIGHIVWRVGSDVSRKCDENWLVHYKHNFPNIPKPLDATNLVSRHS